MSYQGSTHAAAQVKYTNIGPGGWKCSCCGYRGRIKTSVKRSAKRAEQREAAMMADEKDSAAIERRLEEAYEIAQTLDDLDYDDRDYEAEQRREDLLRASPYAEGVVVASQQADGSWHVYKSTESSYGYSRTYLLFIGLLRVVDFDHWELTMYGVLGTEKFDVPYADASVESMTRLAEVLYRMA